MKVQTEISTIGKLHYSDFMFFGGYKNKKNFWWLKEYYSDVFIKIPKVPGFRCFERTLMLEPGWYMIGCGVKGWISNNCIRHHFLVRSDGTICW